MDMRTNFVKIGNLPTGVEGEELFKMFDPFGDLLEMTAISESSLIVTYMRRSAARNCKQLIHHQLYLGNNVISAEYYYPREDPEYGTNSLLQGLGKNIANDEYVYDWRTYVPWKAAGEIPNCSSSVAGGANAAAVGGATGGVNAAAVGGATGGVTAAAFGGAIAGVTAAAVGGATKAAASGATGGATAAAVSGATGGTTAATVGRTGRSSAAAVGPAFAAASEGAVVRETRGVRARVPSIPQPGTSTCSKRKIVIGGEFGKILTEHTIPWRLPSDQSEIDDCAICLDSLGNPDSYNIFSDASRALSLSMCNHAYHQECLEALLRKSPTQFLQCPTCKKVYGIRTGNRPLTGAISHKILDVHLPGHEQHRTIEIKFNFSGGKQGPEHPHPGSPYKAVDFPRRAYLPDNERGIEALHGVYIAWDQRLLFTVGRSLTSNRDDVITWNDIHMKTRIQAVEHGYPDPAYLNNLLQELKGFGICDATISSHMAKYPDLRERGTK